MDANGTRFHLLLGYDNWADCLDERMRRLREAWEASPAGSNATGLAWNETYSELTLQPRLFLHVAAAKDNPPSLDQRRGAARDRYGNWYWIDSARRKILVNSAGDGLTADFWPPVGPDPCPPAPRYGDFQPTTVQAAPAPLELRGLAVTEDHYLVVGVALPSGLLVFDLHAGGPPRQIFWPEEIGFVPFDMAAMPGGGVWILDRDNRRYWALDRHFHVMQDDQATTILRPPQVEEFQPLVGGPARVLPARTFPGGISLAAASPVAALDPIAIEALPDCTVLILDRNPGEPFSLVYRYHFAQQLGHPVSTDSVARQVEETKRASFRLTGHDFAFVAEYEDEEGKTPDRLYIVGTDGNQAFAFNISQQEGQLVLQPPDEGLFYPMRLFGGKALVGAGQGAYYDFGNGWIPLVAQRRPRYVESAICHTPVLDGRDPNCVWHRLMLDGCLPPGTGVTLWSRAADETRELELAAWQPEPQLYLRGDGSELPYVRQARGPENGTWELLFQRARGRYLQVRIELQGDGRATPRLRAMRLYYPRFSYLDHYLPALYREESEPASFLDRFLANLEGLSTALEDKIAAVQILFDVRSAPPETLEWLAGWFEVALDPAWDEARRRLFIRHAMAFFQYRGTIRGLLMALRLTLDECPEERIFSDPAVGHPRAGTVRIVESYRTRRTPGVVFGDASELSVPRLLAPAAQWRPVQGGAELHRRYAEYLVQHGASSSAFPLQAPPDSVVASLWQQFGRSVLGFTPSASAADLSRWQESLARRYRNIGAFNDAYRLGGGQRLASFADVPLPSVLPPDGASLQDWYQFESVVIAMQRRAHRFTVLLPTAKTAAPNAESHQIRLAIARRILDLEKPAHTVYEVKYYWALFQVGAARLGEDTLLDRGSRARELLPAFVLGQGFLAEGYLAPGHPQDVPDRLIAGRDRLSSH